MRNYYGYTDSDLDGLVSFLSDMSSEHSSNSIVIYPKQDSGILVCNKDISAVVVFEEFRYRAEVENERH